MNNFNIPILLKVWIFCILVIAMASCGNGDKEDFSRVPDCQNTISFQIGELDTPEIVEGGEIHFRNKSNIDSLQLILAKGDLDEAIKHSEMPRFWFDFGDGTADSSNKSLEVRHEYKVREGEETSVYKARLNFFDIPCETKPIEITVKKKPETAPVVNAKIKVNKTRIYEGQPVELEEYGTGTFAWEWYEKTTMIGKGQKIKYTPKERGVKEITCKVNHAEGNKISVTPQSLEVTVIRKPTPPNPGKGKVAPPTLHLPVDPPTPSVSKFEGVILPALAKDLEKKMNFDLNKRGDFTKQVNDVIEAFKAKYPEYEGELKSSKISIQDEISPAGEKITTLSALRNQVSNAADVAANFKGSKIKAVGGKLKITK
jgi:hypothetical protein